MKPYVENKPPIAKFTYSPENPVVNERITFNASDSFDPDGNITAYEWEFGDGANGTGETVNHSYSATGNYTVNLTVSDDKEAENSTSEVVNVTEKTIFDTGAPSNPYPSIFGTHEGTIAPSQDIFLNEVKEMDEDIEAYNKMEKELLEEHHGEIAIFCKGKLLAIARNIQKSE